MAAAAPAELESGLQHRNSDACLARLRLGHVDSRPVEEMDPDIADAAIPRESGPIWPPFVPAYATQCPVVDTSRIGSPPTPMRTCPRPLIQP